MSNIDQKIVDWYQRNKRNLPWRENNDPYKVWLSEIILQQTRVDQGTPYYLRFIKKYPSVEKLANAKEDDVLKLWQGLGYYSRARNLHHTAKFISKELNGQFPNNYSDLLSLRGVGSYTAAAIASISFKQAVAVVDGNVLRVFSRLFNDPSPINEEKTKKKVFKKLNELIPAENPSDFNQGLMELGSLICTPSKPKCSECPIAEHCLAKEANTIELLPNKSKKTKITKLKLDFFHFLDQNNCTLISQRPENGIWAKLYEFPNIESASKKEIKDFPKKISKASEFINTTSFTHVLSHRKIEANFHFIRCEKLLKHNNYAKIDLSTINNLALHRLMTKYLESYNIFD